MGPSLNAEVDGVLITPLRQIPDGRGAVLHMLRNDAPEYRQFGECYFSEIFPGIVKAWKRHTVQTQNLVVPVGRIRLVVYDPRHDAQTQGRLLVLELGRPDAYQRVRIPPGVWYGFACLGSSPALVANCVDVPHDPTESERLPEDSTQIPYVWPDKNKLDAS